MLRPDGGGQDLGGATEQRKALVVAGRRDRAGDRDRGDRRGGIGRRRKRKRTAAAAAGSEDRQRSRTGRTGGGAGAADLLGWAGGRDRTRTRRTAGRRRAGSLRAGRQRSRRSAAGSADGR